MTAPGSLIAIGLGSNLGARESRLAEAIRSLVMVISQIRVGRLYESAPLGGDEQPRYLNSALVGRTHLPAEPLLAVLKFLERRAGRVHGPRWGPRTLDLDLLLYGTELAARPELSLPHPGLRTRAFVLAPLADIAPSLAIPPDGATVAALLARLGSEDLERRDWSEALPATSGETPTDCYSPQQPRKATT
jgi:2-amino-4-hydroxy-6-hydroxymethyldihydropteridine diphosphokinase